MESKDLSILFIKHFGGHCDHAESLRAHALKLLEEMTELCVACGAQESDILNVISTEIEKARTKNEFVKPSGVLSESAIIEEIADTSICLDIVAYHAKVNIDKAKLKKLPVLLQRKFSPNKYGVLKRPDRIDPVTGE